MEEAEGRERGKHDGHRVNIINEKERRKVNKMLQHGASNGAACKEAEVTATATATATIQSQFQLN